MICSTRLVMRSPPLLRYRGRLNGGEGDGRRRRSHEWRSLDGDRERSEDFPDGVRNEAMAVTSSDATCQSLRLR